MAIPERLVPIFLSAIREAHLPLGLPAAICARECGFDEKAVSESGAMGIAQFMPETWRDCWQRWGVQIAPGDDEGDPFNVTHAIPLMVHYLEWLQEQVQDYARGDAWVVALAYTWGIGNTLAWLKRGMEISDVPARCFEYANAVLELTFEYENELQAEMPIGCGAD
jgi:soluble lytic murein transglycosylase-like protein